MGPAFQKKNVDGIYVWEPWLHNIAKLGGNIIFTDLDVDVPGTGVWLARREFIERNPEALRRFLAALDKATQELAKDPSPAVDEIVKRLSVDKATANYIYYKTYTPSYEKQLDPKYRLSMYPNSDLGRTLNEMARFLKETGRINTMPNMDVVFDRKPLENYLKGK
jgi:ABC-type nitrate/sulfonate/bicarbonate transport system substrate-binding protein